MLSNVHVTELYAVLLTTVFHSIVSGVLLKRYVLRLPFLQIQVCGYPILLFSNGLAFWFYVFASIKKQVLDIRRIPAFTPQYMVDIRKLPEV
jgi:hypothetical protein